MTEEATRQYIVERLNLNIDSYKKYNIIQICVAIVYRNPRDITIHVSNRNI